MTKDIEREAFEKALAGNNIHNLKVCTIFDDEKNEYFASDVCDPSEDHIVESINLSWRMWQAAKAQAVPEGFEIGRLQDRITELLDERQELYAQLDAGSTEGFILVEKDLVQSIHQSCVKCLDIDLPPIFRATVCTIRDEVAPLIEAQEPAND